MLDSVSDDALIVDLSLGRDLTADHNHAAMADEGFILGKIALINTNWKFPKLTDNVAVCPIF